MGLKNSKHGYFNVRLALCGYSQVPGADFPERFTSTDSYVTFRVFLIQMMFWNLKPKIINFLTVSLWRYQVI